MTRIAVACLVAVSVSACAQTVAYMPVLASGLKSGGTVGTVTVWVVATPSVLPAVGDYSATPNISLVTSFADATSTSDVSQGWVGPQTAPLSAMSLGANANMNGFLPFCPSPTNCSIIYKDISADPVDAAADAWFHNWYKGGQHLAPNFDSSFATLPWFTVDSSTDTGITYRPFRSNSVPTESDDTVLPLKCGQMITEGGGDPCVPWNGDGRDRHLAIIDRNLAAGTAVDNEAYSPETRNGSGVLYSNTAFNLLQPIEAQSTNGYTSADAAGMPQIAMSVNYEDLAAGEIKHVLRMTVPQSSCGFYQQGAKGLYQSPASHAACGGGSGYKAWMGEWLRIKPSVSMPASCGPQGAVIFNAGKKHGFMVTDNGLFGLFQGTYDPRINQGDVGCMAEIKVTDLEVIKVQNAALVAGELGQEDLTRGRSTVWDQSGKNKANAADTTQASCLADPACGKGTFITNNPPPPTVTSFTASASSIPLGSSVTLKLVTSGAVKSIVDNAYGEINNPAGGTLTANPTQTTTYIAKARNANGYIYSSPVTVKVTGPTASAPVFSPAPGSYNSAQSVTLSSATSDGSTYYTTDRTTPSVGATPYSGPVSISTSKVFKAFTHKDGMIDSPVTTAVYQVLIPGATPQVLGGSTQGLVDTSTLSNTATVNSGSSVLVGLIYVKTTSLPKSVSCNGTAATLIASQATTSSTPSTFALYRVPSVSGGSVTCSAPFNTALTGAMDLIEVSQSSVDAFSKASGEPSNYPSTPCGTLTTTGTNDLVVVFGQGDIFAEKYGGLFVKSGVVGQTIGVPTATTLAPTIRQQNSGQTGCIAVALKP